MDQEGGEMAVPLSTTYGGVGHMIHHNHHHDPSSAHTLPSNNNNGPQLEDHVPFKRAVRYRECLKNHAAAMGGSATDGCGEFMPSGAEGTLEALTCSACSCHRNFHRKETNGDSSSSCHCFKNALGRKLLGYPIPSRAAAPPPHHHPMILSYNNGGGSLPSESDDQAEDGGGMAVGHHHRPEMVKKRFRTKFTPEQKGKMLSFAEKVGWKIQKQEENVVQQFCQEVGVKRRVLKVWMHNNKHSLAKKSLNDMNMNINNSVPNIMQQISSPPQNHHLQSNQV